MADAGPNGGDDAGTLWRDAPVPQHWRGLWRRLSLERPDGSGDTTSTVVWLQTDRLYVDIRVPAGRPSFAGVEGFADLSPDQARWLAGQEGFAGRLRWRPGAAHWRRAVDFNPLAGPPDEGRLEERRRVLLESGLHADYVEVWWQEAPGTPVAGAVSSAGTIAVAAGETVMIAHDERPRPPPPGRLAALVEVALAEGAPLEPLLATEVALGRREGDGQWRTILSTLPWREGLVRPWSPG